MKSKITQKQLEQAKRNIFSDIASCINNTNNEDWDLVIIRAEGILNAAKQLKEIGN
jgi:hypothetical protein